MRLTKLIFFIVLLSNVGYTLPRGGRHFDGDDWATIDTTNDTLLQTTTFTCMAWIKRMGTMGEGGVFGKIRISPSAGWSLNIVQSEVRIMAFKPPHPSDRVVTSGANISSETWHHIATTQEGTNGFTNVYVNGNLMDSARYSINSSDDHFVIGRVYPDNDSSYFTGIIDEIQMWNIVLSTSQINYYMTNPPMGREDNLILNLHMDEEAGGFCDYSGNNFHAIIKLGTEAREGAEGIRRTLE